MEFYVTNYMGGVKSLNIVLELKPALNFSIAISLTYPFMITVDC